MVAHPGPIDREKNATRHKAQVRMEYPLNGPDHLEGERGKSGPELLMKPKEQVNIESIRSVPFPCENQGESVGFCGGCAQKQQTRKPHCALRMNMICRSFWLVRPIVSSAKRIGHQ